MTIPEEEREVISNRLNRVAYHLEDGFNPVGLLYPYTEEQADVVRGLLDDLHYVQHWLEAQADAPEPWEPVEVGAKIDVQGSIERKVLYRMDENVLAILAVDDNTVRGAEMLYLPDDVRLYRRMEVTE